MRAPVHRHRPGGRRPTTRAVTLTAASAAVGLLLAACGTTTETSTEQAGATPATAEFPRTVTSCGVETTLEAPPERIVTIKSSATEMVLALGAGDRVVGHGFPDGPVPEELADAAADLTLLSDQVPASETVLETEPDLVYAGWESNLTGDGAGERETLERLGVATYVSPSACKDPGLQPDRLGFEDVFDEVREVGAILGEEGAAEALVAEQQAALDQITPDGRGLTALWYSSGTDIPYVGAGIGAPQMILDAVGLENIAADVADTWTSYSWEQVVAADPDVIVLVDATWNPAEDKIARLEGNPATAELTAVREGRYLVVPFAATEAGVRNVPLAVDLADRLAALDLG